MNASFFINLFTGSFLQYEFSSTLDTSTDLQICTIDKPDASYLLAKRPGWSHALLRNILSFEETRFNGLPTEG